jgi:hypothetical protein
MVRFVVRPIAAAFVILTKGALAPPAFVAFDYY